MTKRKPTKPAAKKLYHVPKLKPEYCTKEYMDAAGLPYPCCPPAYRWGCVVFPRRIGGMQNRVYDRFPDSWDGSFEAFNAAMKSLGARPTGKPYPLPRKATR